MSETIKIAVAQLDMLVGDIEGNAERIILETQKISKAGTADLILFPELSICGYPPEDLVFRPGFHSRCQAALHKIEAAVKDITIVVGYPERLGDKLYNRAAVIQNGRIIAAYSKQVLPNYAVFDEKRYFSPGNIPCIFNIKNTRIGLLICEDIWHVKPAKQAALAGAQLIVTINASPYNREQVKARENTLSARAHETHLPVIYTNNVGGQDEVVFDGGSMVVNAQGQRCQQAPYYKEDIMIVTAHSTGQGAVKIDEKPLPPRLSEEENIYNTLTLAIKDYVNKNHFPGVIIGLSGGIDSALTLALACDALGAENVIAVMMPSQFTSQMSLEDAAEMAKTLGVKYHVIEIDKLYNEFHAALAPIFHGLGSDRTEENLQARIRASIVMAMSNKLGHLVLTTSNKSEAAVGYATLYGDMAGGFSPLKDVLKTMVYRLSSYRNSINQIIPERVTTRAPSAELAHGQTDQNDLPPYHDLDQMLHKYIEKDEPPEQLYQSGFDKNTVDKVVRMVARNEYKRRQAPIGVRLTQRAFGKDRRYPVTSGFIRGK